MQEENKDDTKTSERERRVDTFRTLFFKASSLAAQLIGIVFVAYVIGWIRAETYYSAFGASWIAGQLSQAQLLNFSKEPLIFFLIAWGVVSETVVTYEVSLNGLSKTKLILAFLFCLGFILYFVKPDDLGGYFKISLSLIYLILFSLWIAVEVNFITLLHLNDKMKRPSVLFHLIPFLCIWFLFWFPIEWGTTDALRDMNINTTTLRRVVLKGSTNVNRRLLGYDGNNFVVVTLPGLAEKENHLSLQVVKSEDILKIIGPKYQKL